MALILHNSSFDKDINFVDYEELIKTSVQSDNIDDFVLIVPTGRLTRHLKLKLIEKYYAVKQKPAPKINIHNLESFAERCLNSILPKFKYRLISDAYRITLTEEAIKNTEPEFYDYRKHPLSYHVIERISNIIYGLREDGVSSSNMKEEISKNNEELTGIKDKKKYGDLAKILNAYESLLGDKYLDVPSVYKKLTLLAEEFELRTNGSNIFDNYSLINKELRQILIHGFSDFKNPEVHFLSKFANSKIPLAIHLDFSEVNGPLFGNLREMKEILLTAGFGAFYTDEEIVEQTIILPENELESSPKYFLRRWLFNVEREIKFGGLSDIVEIFEFDTLESEVKGICKLIKHLIFDKDIKPGEIALVMRNTSAYTPLLRSSFLFENLPSNFSERYPLSESPVVISIFAALDTVSKGYKKNDVFKTLESIFIKVYDNEQDAGELPNLIQAVNELRFSKGNIRLNKEFWIQRLGRMTEYLNSLINREENQSDSIELKNLEKSYKRFDKALNYFKAFSDRMPVVKNKYSPDEFRDLIITGIINNFDYVTTIKKLHNRIENKFQGRRDYYYHTEIEKVEKFSRALSEFVRLLNEMTFILNENDIKEYNLNDLTEKLKLTVSGARYQTRERQNYGITVTSVEQIREIPYRVTILCGMNDGAFPMPYRPESFLGKELYETELRHLQSEQIQFYNFLTNGLESSEIKSKKVYLTYSCKREGFETSRSSFIDSLLKVSDIENKKRLISFTQDSINSGTELPDWYYYAGRRSMIASVIGNKLFQNKRQQELNSIFPVASDGNDEIKEIFEFTKRISARPDESESLSQELLSPESSSRIENYYGAVFSASDFEKYAGCPYKYFASKLLKLQEKSEEEPLFTALEFGNIMHRAFQKFYLRLQKESSENWIIPQIDDGLILPFLKPVDIRKIPRVELIMKLNNCIMEEFQDIRLDHPAVVASRNEIIGYADEKTVGWAELFIDSELKRLALFKSFPSLFEFEFGNKKSNPISDLKLSESFRLRGKVDRIEVGDKLQNSEHMINFSFTIADYKSSDSSASKNSDIEAGRKFQMPLYSIAMQKILNDYYNIDIEFKGAAYYIIKPKPDKNGFSDTKVVLMSDEINPLSGKSKKFGENEQKELLEIALKNAENLVHRISSAQFPVEPNNNTECKYCSFSSVCRINERRIIENDDEENE